MSKEFIKVIRLDDNHPKYGGGPVKIEEYKDRKIIFTKFVDCDESEDYYAHLYLGLEGGSVLKIWDEEPGESKYMGISDDSNSLVGKILDYIEIVDYDQKSDEEGNVVETADICIKTKEEKFIISAYLGYNEFRGHESFNLVVGEIRIEDLIS